MDGTYEENEGLIHFMQHMNADGLQSEIEGWYQENRLYMTYNTVNYYEDMEPEQVRELLLVPLGMHAVNASAIESLEKEETDKGTVFTLILNPEGARELFDSRYDIYGLSQYEDYTVKSAKAGVVISASPTKLCETEDVILNCEISKG